MPKVALKYLKKISNLEQIVLREEMEELIVGDWLIFSCRLFHSLSPAALKGRSLSRDMSRDLQAVKGPSCYGDISLHPWIKQCQWLNQNAIS